MENTNNIKWKIEEYKYKKKSPDWFWALWIISIAIIFISVMFGSSLFAILIFISSFTLSLQAVKKPNLINFEITKSGILSNEKKYPYKNIESYRIEDSEFKLLLKLKSKLMPVVTIPLSKNLNIEKVDDFLSDYLKKEEIEEPITNKLVNYL